MATLFYDSFQNTNSWVGGNSQSPTITVVSDPKGQYQKVVNFGVVREKPDSFSSLISNTYKSFTVNFDYLGKPLDQSVAVNLGCVISIADGASLTDLTMAYAGAVINAYPPVDTNYLCRNFGSSYCYIQYYKKIGSFEFLIDDSVWHHYSISFTTTNSNIRVVLGDFSYSNYPSPNNPGDCYFANLLVTDSYGPSPFTATSSPENFRSISVDVLSQVADTVSYINSNTAVNINLGAKIASGGYAEGDVLNDIVNIIGSNYDDILIGGEQNNTLNGGNGNDILTAGKGSDILIGGNGNDKFIISTEITKATISDFSINDDVIDLRFFTSFYNLQSILSASSYTNGNTVVNLGGGKTMVLSGINYNDLKESNFILTRLSPTSQPSIFPTIQPTSPTVEPTFSPTKLPTLNPTSGPTLLPSAVPTTIPTKIPTITPSVSPSYEPTFSPTIVPTKAPSFSPTNTPSDLPSKLPSVMPSLSPTSEPTTSPTYSPTISSKPTTMPTFSPTAYPTAEDGYHNIYIDDTIKVPYIGSKVADKFLVTALGTTTITGGEGNDYYVVFNNLDSTLVITDFDVSAPEKIDLTDFTEIHSIKDLTPRSSGGYVILTLQDSQEIRLKGITLGSVTDENFAFSHSSLESSDSHSNNDLIIMGVGIALGGIILGLCYMTYAAVYHHYPFAKNYDSTPQNDVLHNNFEQHNKVGASAPAQAHIVSGQKIYDSVLNQQSIELTYHEGDLIINPYDAHEI